MAKKIQVSVPETPISTRIAHLYDENITAKIYRTATKHLEAQGNSRCKLLQTTNPLAPECLPQHFPETVAQHGDSADHYTMRDPDFWTCGFFPGMLYSLLERYNKVPRSTNLGPGLDVSRVRSELLQLCKLWSEPLHAMAKRKDTHDVGFIIMPALQKDWEMTGNTRSLDSIICAACSLASRYIPAAQVIRSWDSHVTKDNSFTCQEENGLIIIDSMCNLDLLYYAASHLPPADGQVLRDIATKHADIVIRTNLRPEAVVKSAPEYSRYMGQWYSTCHLANVDPKTGELKRQITAQGYSDSSTWSRGQAWGVLGYAQTYMWTKDQRHLDVACGLAEYFLHRMQTSPDSVENQPTSTNGHANGNGHVNGSSHINGNGHVNGSTHVNGNAHRNGNSQVNGNAHVDGNGHAKGHVNGVSKNSTSPHRPGRYVPLWDFDAPIEDHTFPLRDSSAGSIAANGMLIISQALTGLGNDLLATRFRSAAVDIVEDLLTVALAPEKARLSIDADGAIEVEDCEAGETFEGLMKYGTVNYHEHALNRRANQGIVYGDYYLVEFGNMLLKLGLD